MRKTKNAVSRNFFNAERTGQGDGEIQRWDGREEPWHALGESNPSFQNENLTS